MNIQEVHFQGQITDVKTNKDKGLRLVFHTQELTPEEKAVIFELHDKHAFIAVAPDQIQDFKPKEGVSSPSKRLRAAMFYYYRDSLRGLLENFDEYYEKQIEGLIKHYRARDI